MTTAYLGLGSNMGDREMFLRQAVALLAAESDITVKKVSSIYETEPVGFTDQGAFLNAVAIVETELSAVELLSKCLAVEQRLQRVRDVRWGPRTIDIDILLFGEQVIDDPKLIVPHPRLGERLFVLVPLHEVAPDITFGGKTVADHIAQLTGRDGINWYRTWN